MNERRKWANCRVRIWTKKKLKEGDQEVCRPHLNLYPLLPFCLEILLIMTPSEQLTELQKEFLNLNNKTGPNVATIVWVINLCWISYT
jgi:hypothetical protein